MRYHNIWLSCDAWWRYQMETFPRNWPFVRGIHRSPVNSPPQRPVTRSFDVFFDLRLNKRLSKQSWGLWFETLLCPLWLHCNGLNSIELIGHWETWLQQDIKYIHTHLNVRYPGHFLWDCLQHVTRPHYHTASGNGLMLSGNRLLPGAMLTQIYVLLLRYLDAMT